MKRGFKNRILAMFVCACIVLTILSATGFAISHGEHECNRVHCAVCQHLGELATVSKNLGAGVGNFLSVAIVTDIFLKELPKFFGKVISGISLISLKVRMNN